MKQDEYREWMEKAGWQYDEGRCPAIFIIDLDDRQLISFAGFSQVIDCFTFEDGGSVGFPWYSQIIKKISPRMGGHIWLVQRHNSFLETFGKGSAGFIIECTDELIKWAKSIDLEEEIKKLAEHDKAYEGYSHLAALALTGDFDQLQYYLKLRETDPGNNPYIPGTLGPECKTEHIERAIEIAIHYQKHPMDWSDPKGF